MSHYLNDKFIVIKAVPIREMDLLIKLVSAELGFVMALARGALKSKKRFGGGLLEPFHYIEGSLYKSNSTGQLQGSYFELKEGQLLEDFKLIRQDYNRVSLGFQILSYYDKLDVDHVAAKSLFFLLGHTLRALAKTSNLLLLEVQFMAKFLFDQGVLDSRQGNEIIFRYIEARYDTLSADLTTISRDRLNLLTQLKGYLNLN